jgi:DNA-binding transcriptional LysR family regulator
MARAAAPVQRITIGVMPGLLGTAAVRAFEAGDPSRRAEVIQAGWSDQVNVVRQGRADIVYAREPFDHSGLGALPLLEEPRDVALPASDPLAAKASLRLVDLADRRLLQDPATVPEWYEIATPARRRACVGAAAQTVPPRLPRP